jgi:hypothetical protein
MSHLPQSPTSPSESPVQAAAGMPTSKSCHAWKNLGATAASQVILESHLPGINDRRAKKEISFVLTFIKGIVFVANRIIFFANAAFQSF